MQERDDAASPYRRLPLPLRYARLLIHWARIKRITALRRVKLEHGPHFAIAKGADIRPPQYFRLGHHVSIGKNFTCETDLTIGNYVLISSNVSVVGKDHPFDDPTRTVFTQARVENSPVSIGSDVLVGYGTIIVGPVTIGDGCIIGSGAVVTRDLPPYTICAGVPARPIRPRYPAQ